MQQLMVINRIWKYQDVPIFKPISLDTWEEAWYTFVQNFNSLHKRSPDYKKSGFLHSLDKVEGEEKFILKTQIDLSTLINGAEHVEEFSTKKEKIREWILKEIYEQDSTFTDPRVLFLLHKSENFLSHPSLINTCTQAKDFGGGKEFIYGKSGILSASDQGYFTDMFEPINNVVRPLKESHKWEIRRRENYQNVWDYYWFQTPQKLHLLRKSISDFQIPMYPDKKKAKVISFVKSFLESLHEGKSKPLVYNQPVDSQDWSFSSHDDLYKFKCFFSNSLLEQLTALLALSNRKVEAVKFDILNLELDQMTTKLEEL
ncbi:MAG: hypothetical protein AAF696_20935 [Bacteroidota bacterium]